MPGNLLFHCTYPGCSVLTMGTFCVHHETPVVREFVRGRPWLCPDQGPTALLVRRQRRSGARIGSG